MSGKFIVIEGLDGCGKSTQLTMLRNAFEQEGLKCQYIHFPLMQNGVYGPLVAEFLRGEFGTLEMVHPKLVSLLFALDRMDNKETISQWIDEGMIVLADRYVYSNIAYQCAKLNNDEEKENLKKWILNYEFGHNQLPIPNASLFLHVPLSFVRDTLKSERNGEDRTYLNGEKDIHESSIYFQENVYSEYLKLLQEERDIIEIPCMDANNHLLSKELIHSKIKRIVDNI